METGNHLEGRELMHSIRIVKDLYVEGWVSQPVVQPSRVWDTKLGHWKHALEGNIRSLVPS